jgi:phenylacetate-CoA ligase
MLEDSLYRLRRLYDRSPELVRTLVGATYRSLPARLVHGPQYRHFRELIQRFDRATAQELAAYQLQQLQELVEHAYRHVPYYRRSFDAASVRPEDIRRLEDIERLPLLTKEDVQQHRDELVATDAPARLRLYMTTGGSTGIPVGFYLQRWTTRPKELAFMEDQWSRVGYRRRDRCAILRGTPLPDGQLFRLDPARGHLVMSSYHLTAENARAYVAALERFRPRFVQAYPSSAMLLATHMQELGLATPPGIAALLAGSENLFPTQRRLLESVFGCRVFSWYGHAERLVLGGECEHSTDYHLYPQYGIAELAGDGEVVATGFHNRVMPLIRYRTMDRAVRADGPCACGREYPRLRSVEGRLQELLVTAGGRRISMTAINMHSPVFDRVRQFQFRQSEVGRVTFTYVPRPGFGAEDVAQIRAELFEKLGDDVDLALEAVERIDPSPSGKHRFLLQQLPDSFLFSS